MIKFVIISSLFVVMFGCVQHHEKEIEITPEIERQEQIEIKYAEGFEIEYHTDFIKVITHSIAQNETFRDSIYVVLKETAELDERLKLISFGNNKLACQSSTYLAYIDQLEGLEQVCAICGLTYVKDEKVLSILEQNDIVELCLTDQIQTEALLKAGPDLFLTFPYGMQGQQNFGEKGINTFLIAEYLETSQLARIEWIKLFGLLVGEVEMANAYFEEIEEEYLALKGSVNKREETFIMNLPFQDQWFMPAANSVGVKLIEDAGLTYFYEGGKGTENEHHSAEQVWNDAVGCDYWVIVAMRDEGYTMDDLLEEQPVYKTFKSVQNKHVIFCNTSEVDYFAKGTIEPNVILKDLLFATGEIEAHNPKYFFLLE